MAMSVPEAFDGPPMEKVFVLGDTEPPRMTPARRRVLDIAQDNVPRRSAELAEQAAVSSGVVKGLADAGALIWREIPSERPFATPQPDHGRQTLSPDQSTAAEYLTGRVAQHVFAPVLLEGVTGSGKTAVYFDAIAEALRQDRAVLVLLPEIALTAQWLERFHDRFGVAPAQWHSDLSRTERRRVWRAVSEGRVPVLVGARSALFLPFENLGLIVVDEEHDSSFKQEEGVAYNARDMAIVRGPARTMPGCSRLCHTLARNRGQCQGQQVPSRVAPRAARWRADAGSIGDRYAVRGHACWPMDFRCVGTRGPSHHRGGRTGPPVSQSSGICPAHTVPRLRAPVPMSQLPGLAR